MTHTTVLESSDHMLIKVYQHQEQASIPPVDCQSRFPNPGTDYYQYSYQVYLSKQLYAVQVSILSLYSNMILIHLLSEKQTLHQSCRGKELVAVIEPASMEHLAGMKLTAAQVPRPNYHFPVTKRKKRNNRTTEQCQNGRDEQARSYGS